MTDAYQPRLTIPASAKDSRAKKAARQARWRANAKRKAEAAAIVDHVMGVGEGEAPPRPDIPPGDLALLLRDRFHKVINGLTDEQLLSKDFAPALALGLKSQTVLDAREKHKAKTGQTLELLAGLRGILTGAIGPAPLQIEDGTTIEGEFEEA